MRIQLLPRIGSGGASPYREPRPTSLELLASTYQAQSFGAFVERYRVRDIVFRVSPLASALEGVDTFSHDQKVTSFSSSEQPMLVFLVIERVVCRRLPRYCETAAANDSFMGWNRIPGLSKWSTPNYNSKNRDPAKYRPDLASSSDH